MNILALEWSAERGGVALCTAGKPIAQQSVSAAVAHAGQLLTAVEEARRLTGWDWDQIDCYAVGCGPGRYSGLRTAVTVARHLALPGKTPIRAVSSGDALAAELAATHPDAAHLAIIGDARRERIWWRHYDNQAGRAVAQGSWTLTTQKEWLATIPAKTWVGSPDWERLHSLRIAAQSDTNLRWIEHPCMPNAEWVARLAWMEEIAGTAPRPCSPIYLHPPVAAKDAVQ